MRKSVLKAVEAINLPKKACHILLGKDHKKSHRLMLGGVVMVGVVCIAKVLQHHSPEGVHFVIEACAGLIHAVGAAPYLELIFMESEA
jgi:hypothetical protein